MINLAALGGMRAWTPIAECGFSSIFFLTVSILGFFIPLSLIAAELATGWPKANGVYGWVKEAFGHKWGFLALWLLWTENVIWYPTILSFIAATVSYAIDPSLAANPAYNVLLILGIFWGVTGINLIGVKASNWMSTLGAVCGTFLPSFLIIGLGLSWYLGGKPLQISMDFDSLIPDLGSPQQLALLGGIMMSLVGIEMSAVHASDVENPQRNYPRAILLSAAAVIFFSTLGVLGIAIVVPQSELLLNAGALQAFTHFLSAYGLQSLVPWIGLVIAIGAMGSVSTWVVGPCRGLISMNGERGLPPVFNKVSKNGMPRNLLLFQAVLVSIMALVFLFMPSVNSAYWMLMVLTTQLYLLMYILLFAAAIRLRSKRPDVKASCPVPGGKIGLWTAGLLGLGSSIFSFFICFVPPAQIHAGSTPGYVGFLAVSALLLCLVPVFLLRKKAKPSQETAELRNSL